VKEGVKNRTMIKALYSFRRFWAILKKEFIQMKRDRVTFAMIIGIPIMQIILFGFAINSNPKNLPTVIVNGDHSPYTRRFVRGLEHTDYFKFIKTDASEKEARYLMATNRAEFILNIPTDFSRELIRGHRPKLLMTVDATDPMLSGSSMAVASLLANRLFNEKWQGALSYLRPQPPPFELEMHPKYNPEQISYYNIVPGLIGLLLTMTLVMITASVMTREVERGTMENLLAMPIRPIEVMLGKILPYVLVGYFQLFFILLTMEFIFHIPFSGSVFLLCLIAFPFILANLSVGLMFSTAAKNQLQAQQMSIFFFMPAILLSGFMFPFYGMPMWAQWIGRILPLTYFLRITRGIVLKGNGWVDSWPNIWPIIIFMTVVLSIGLIKYRRTLD
jgi:ABC-2 type transport system permease protein